MEEKVSEIPQTTEVKTETTKAKLSAWVMVAGVAIGVLLTGSMAAAVYFYNKAKQPVMVLPVLPETSIAPTTGAKPTAEETGIKWISPPVKISRLNIFQTEATRESENSMFPLDDSAVEFYKVAELDDEAILINMTILYGPEWTLVRLIEKKDMSYEYLAAYLDKWVIEELERILLPGVTASNKRFDGLETPEEITVAGKTYIMGYGFVSFEDLENSIAMADNLYRVETKILDSDQIFARVIYLRLKDGIMIPYSLKNSAYPDDQKPYINWGDGVSGSEISFRQAIVSSCGSGMASSVPIIKEGSPLLTGKVEVGKWQGQPIYQVKDKSSEFVKKLYENYKIGRDYPEADPMVSLEEFANQKNHFLWKDRIGDWQIFVNQDFAPLAECGKPVIYLYPEKKTEIKVAVGAKISKSEPEYPKNGWQVTAYPEGKLIFQGKEYESLFWEGLGEGVYPDLRNEGTVVRQSEMVEVLNKQLRQLGLNEKEAEDFMEFWQARLPKTPWVRLTWLGTREMDRLAPLAVEPKPETSIRIFLEFEGMEKAKELKPQKLGTVERRGFTLVEWGGLLIGG